MERLFGIDGVRGIANRDHTPHLALDLSIAARVLGEAEESARRRPVAVVGRDTRASGEFLSAAVEAGLAAAGVNVYDAGVLPTPAVAFLTADTKADFGVSQRLATSAASTSGAARYTASPGRTSAAHAKCVNALWQSLRSLKRLYDPLATGELMGLISKVLQWPGTMFAVVLLVSACGGAPRAGAPGHDQAAANGGWTQVWRDDFTGPAGSPVSSARWRYDTGTHYPGGSPGWGNNELETYTTSTKNVYLDGRGDLAIRPIRNGRGTWTSGRLETQRADFQPSAGTSLAFSARIRLPAGGQGYWPAFWMLGGPFRSDITDWPAAGELDAMENINDQPMVDGTLHCGTLQAGGPCHETTGLTATYNLGRAAGAAGFHTYTVVWNTNPERIRWYVDGKSHLTITAGMIGSSTWRSTFDHGFFILLNVAIGGRWPGNPDTRTVSGQPMLIDKVIVAKNSSGSAGPPPN